MIHHRLFGHYLAWVLSRDVWLYVGYISKMCWHRGTSTRQQTMPNVNFQWYFLVTSRLLGDFTLFFSSQKAKCSNFPPKNGCFLIMGGPMGLVKDASWDHDAWIHGWCFNFNILYLSTILTGLPINLTPLCRFLMYRESSNAGLRRPCALWRAGEEPIIASKIHSAVMAPAYKQFLKYTHIYIYIYKQYHQMSRRWVLVESVLKKRFHDFMSSSVLTFEPMLKKRCYHFMSSKEQILPTRFPTRCRPMPSKAPQRALLQHLRRFHSTLFGCLCSTCSAFTAPFALS